MTHAHAVQQAFRDLEAQARVHTHTLEMLKARVLPRFTVADHAHDAGSVSGGPQTSDPRRDEYVQRLQGDLAEARSWCDSLLALASERGREQRKAENARAIAASKCDDMKGRHDSAMLVLAERERERDEACAALEKMTAARDAGVKLRVAQVGAAREQCRKVLTHTRTELADALGALEQERAARQTYQREFVHAMREVERLKASEAASAERERKLVNALRVCGEKRAEAERSRKVLTDQVAALHGWDPSDNAVQVMQEMLIFSGAGQSAVRAGLRAAFVHDHLDARKLRT